MSVKQSIFFFDKWKLSKFMTSTSVAYEILKEVLQAEGKWKQMAVHIRMKRWKVLEMVNAWVRGIFQLSLPLKSLSLWAEFQILLSGRPLPSMLSSSKPIFCLLLHGAYLLSSQAGAGCSHSLLPCVLLLVVWTPAPPPFFHPGFKALAFAALYSLDGQVLGTTGEILLCAFFISL